MKALNELIEYAEGLCRVSDFPETLKLPLLKISYDAKEELEELEKTRDGCITSVNMKLKEQRDKLVETLTFYAEGDNYAEFHVDGVELTDPIIFNDCGKKARQALKDCEKTGE